MTTRQRLESEFFRAQGRLTQLAQGMLGAEAAAQDAVQTAWLRLQAVEQPVENPSGWLTTVVARICLDMLRADKRGEARLLSAEQAQREPLPSPDAEVWLADSLGVALTVVLETLPPAERLAFMLHDVFDVPFEEIAAILGRTSAAARQLASRARRKVRGVMDDEDKEERQAQQELVDAFLAASRQGDFEALLTLLAPDVVLRADPAAVGAAAASTASGAPALAPQVLGANAVAAVFRGRAQAARAAVVDGEPAAVWVPAQIPRAVFAFEIVQNHIQSIEIICESSTIQWMSIEIINN